MAVLASKTFVQRAVESAVKALRTDFSGIQHRAASVTLPALAVGANAVTATWSSPMPDNVYLTVACYAGNSAFPDLSGVVVAVMPDTQTPTSVDIRVTNTTASPIGAGRKVNVYAIHGGG